MRSREPFEPLSESQILHFLRKNRKAKEPPKRNGEFFRRLARMALESLRLDKRFKEALHTLHIQVQSRSGRRTKRSLLKSVREKMPWRQTNRPEVGIELEKRTRGLLDWRLGTMGQWCKDRSDLLTDLAIRNLKEIAEDFGFGSEVACAISRAGWEHVSDLLMADVPEIEKACENAFPGVTYVVFFRDVLELFELARVIGEQELAGGQQCGYRQAK